MALSGDLVVTDLHKAFGTQPVLTGVDLVVPAGSFTAVLGPSGSGKTTLLRILAGFERPDRGRVAIGDAVLDDEHGHVLPERRRIGYVSQEGSLFPHLSVLANVGFGLPRRQRRDARIRDLLDMAGMADLAGRYPHQLSGGQQQRVALARALAVEPRVVLLDEPFASLDANLRSSVRADVHAILRAAGATAILVTHDQDEALSVADLVAVIRKGRVAQLAAPADLYDQPADAELGRFVGEANLIEGRSHDGLVVTPFGALAVRGALDAPSGHPVTVLIRPEQVVIDGGTEGPGVAARVESIGFHGHDAVISLAPLETSGLPPMVARVLGESRLHPGTEVRLAVRGPVGAWPAPADRRPGAALADGPESGDQSGDRRSAPARH
jgi:iron(III) transport system ATP-binding protein